MLSENVKNLRKAKGLSQEELAVKLNVVRQTVSKWEKGLSVPDADMLIALSEALDAPVSTLLGETVAAPEADGLKAISEKLEVINTQLARRKETGRRWARGLLIALACLLFGMGLLLFFMGSPYLGWDFGDPETAVAGTAFHAFEWIFVRTAPVLFLAAVAGIILTGKKRG